MKKYGNCFQIVFFFSNVLFSSGKFSFFFSKRLPEKLEKLDLKCLNRFFPLISKTFFFHLDYISDLENINLKIYKQKRFLSLILFHDCFYSDFFFRKKKNFDKTKIEVKYFIFYVQIFQDLFPSQKAFFSMAQIEHFFNGKDPRNYYKKKRLKKSLIKNIGKFFYRFNFLKVPHFLKTFFDCSIFFSFFDSILFYFEKYAKNFHLRTIQLSFLSSFVLELSIRENQPISFKKKGFRNSFLIKKKTKWLQTKLSIGKICLKELQRNWKKFEKKRRKKFNMAIISNLEKKIFEKLFRIHFCYILTQNYFQNFLTQLTEEGIMLLKYPVHFLGSFRNKKILEIIKSLLTFFITSISKRSGKIILKNLEPPLHFFMDVETLVSKPIGVFENWENYGRILFRFFSFLKKPFYPVLICVYFLKFAKIHKIKEFKVHQKILSRYNDLLPWSELSLQSFKIFSKKQNCVKIKTWGSLLFCRKCSLGVVCCIIGNTLKENNFYLEYESVFNISLRSFPVKISNVNRVRNYIISFYHLILTKISENQKFLDLKKKLFRLLTNCTSKLFEKQIKKKIFFAKIKKKLQSVEGFLFFLFILDSNFLLSIWVKKKSKIKPRGNLRMFENFYKDLVYKNLSKTPSEKLSEFFSMAWEKFFVFSLDLNFFSSLGPNRDTFSCKKTFRLLNRFEKKYTIDKLKNSDFSLILSSNFSNFNKNNFFRFFRYFFLQQKKKSFDYKTFINKIIFESIKWEKKVSRTLFSYKKIFLKEIFGFSPEKLHLFLFFSFFLDLSINSEELINFYDFLFEKVKKPFLLLEFLNAFTLFFEFWKEKRDLYLLRENSMFFLTFKGILNLVKICFFSKRKQESIVLFSKFFYSSLVIFKDPLIILSEILIFYYFLSIFSKNNNTRFQSHKGISVVFKNLSIKIKKQKKLNIEDKKFSQILNYSETYFFLFLRDFSRIIWRFYSRKNSKKGDLIRNYPLFDRSEIPLQKFSKFSDRGFKYLNYIRKKDKIINIF